MGTLVSKFQLTHRQSHCLRQKKTTKPDSLSPTLPDYYCSSLTLPALSGATSSVFLRMTGFGLTLTASAELPREHGQCNKNKKKKKIPPPLKKKKKKKKKKKS